MPPPLVVSPDPGSEGSVSFEVLASLPGVSPEFPLVRVSVRIDRIEDVFSQGGTVAIVHVHDDGTDDVELYRLVVAPEATQGATEATFSFETDVNVDLAAGRVFRLDRTALIAATPTTPAGSATLPSVFYP